MKVVIVGGVAGGASAAARIRRLDEHAQIVMIERSGYVSYANCGLPYYVGGVIKEQEELTLQTPESFWNRFRILSGIFAARAPAEAGMLRTTNGQSVSWDSHPSEDRSEPSLQRKDGSIIIPGICIVASSRTKRLL